MWNSIINELFSVDKTTTSFSTPKNFRLYAFLFLSVYFILSGIFPISYLAYTITDETTISDILIHFLCAFQSVIVLSLSTPSLLIGKQRVTISKSGTIKVNDQSISLNNLTTVNKNFFRHSITISDGYNRIEISKFIKGGEYLIQAILDHSKDLNNIGVKLGKKTKNTQNYIVVFLIMLVGLGSFSSILVPTIFEEFKVLTASLITLAIYLGILLLSILCPLEFYKKYIFNQDSFIEIHLIKKRKFKYNTIKKITLDKGRSVINIHFQDKKIKVYPTIGLSLEETYNFLVKKIK